MRPVAPIDYTKDLSRPLLGLFGEDDKSPPPEHVAIHEQELKKHGKDYEVHTYPGGARARRGAPRRRRRRNAVRGRMTTS
jgi:dipeptidyl aminopeptidase/acylaminoacyl peptidase